MIQKIVSSPMAVFCFYLIARSYLLTVRVRIYNESDWIKKVQDGEPILICMFHQQFFYIVRFFRKYLIYKPKIMISQSRDGDIGARVAAYSGCSVARGSSSKGGKKAMAQMVDYLEEKQGFCINLVDGPQGPVGKVKPGSIRIAQKSGATIVPAFFNAKNVWQVNSWDRFMIPKPFSSVTLKFGKNFRVDRIKTNEDFEAARQELELMMAPYLQI